MIVDPERDTMVRSFFWDFVVAQKFISTQAKKALDDSPPSYEDANNCE